MMMMMVIFESLMRTPLKPGNIRKSDANPSETFLFLCCWLLYVEVEAAGLQWRAVDPKSREMVVGYTGWRKKTGQSYLIANILKTSWPNCVEIGELLQYYMLNTVINFLFKNFIALWRHLAKTHLLCDAQIYLYSVNKRQ